MISSPHLPQLNLGHVRVTSWSYRGHVRVKSNVWGYGTISNCVLCLLWCYSVSIDIMTDFPHFFEFSNLTDTAFRTIIEHWFQWKSADKQQLQIQKMEGNLSRYLWRLNSTINSTVMKTCLNKTRYPHPQSHFLFITT